MITLANTFTDGHCSRYIPSGHLYRPPHPLGNAASDAACFCMWASSVDTRRQIALAKGADGRIVTRLFQLYGDNDTRFDMMYGVVANALSNTFGRAVKSGDTTAVRVAERNLVRVAVVQRILHFCTPPGCVN